MPPVVIGTANPAFINALRAYVQEQIALARTSHSTSGGPVARARVDALESLDRFIGSLRPDDSRFLAFELASCSRGNPRTHYSAIGRAARILPNAGNRLEGAASDDLFNELLAGEISEAVDHLSEQRSNADHARVQATNERDALLGLQEQLIAAQRDNERLVAEREDRENQVRHLTEQLDFERAAQKPKRAKVTA